MAEERRKCDLDGPSLIAAYLINVNSTKGKTVTPLDVHPYRKSEPRGVTITKANIGCIAKMIVAQAKKK